MALVYKKALVTGGAGFIGSHLVDFLVAKGCRVNVLDNLSTGHLSNLNGVIDQIDFFRGDIRDESLIKKAVTGCDVIFHQAAVVSVPQTVEDPIESASVNDLGTLQVLEIARLSRVKRVILASSSAVYGDDPQLPKHESMPPKTISPYAAHKLTGELYAGIFADIHDLETICLRYFNVFGPRQDPSSPYSGVISIFMDRSINQESPVIFGDGNQKRDFVFVKDVVHANHLAASFSRGDENIFNIASGRAITINRLWEIIGRMAGVSILPEYHPPRIGDIRQSKASIERAQTVLGFEPTWDFHLGLKKTFEWYAKGVNPRE